MCPNEILVRELRGVLMVVVWWWATLRLVRLHSAHNELATLAFKHISWSRKSFVALAIWNDQSVRYLGLQLKT